MFIFRQWGRSAFSNVKALKSYLTGLFVSFYGETCFLSTKLYGFMEIQQQNPSLGFAVSSEQPFSRLNNYSHNTFCYPCVCFQTKCYYFTTIFKLTSMSYSQLLEVKIQFSAFYRRHSSSHIRPAIKMFYCRSYVTSDIDL